MTNTKIDAVLAQEEQLLKAQTAKTMLEYQRDNSVKNLRKYEGAKKALADLEKRRIQAEGFTSIEAAGLWVVEQGYRVTKETVRHHANNPKQGFPKKNKNGVWEKSAVAAYADKTWDGEELDAVKDQIEKEKLRKLQLENDIKEGKYYHKSEEDQRDALVLHGIKSALMASVPFIVQDLIAIVGGALGQEAASKMSVEAPEIRAKLDNSILDAFDGIAKRGEVAECPS